MKNISAKVIAWMRSAGSFIARVFRNIPGINWAMVLAMVILAYMAQNGILDDMPNIKWIVETAIRLLDWLFGLFRDIMEWCAARVDSEWLKAIFGM